MKKLVLALITLCIVCMVLCVSAEKAIPSVNGALHVEGTQLVDENNQPVQLRGLSTHGLAWYPQYVNSACFADLKDGIGVNVIRLAMYTDEYGGYCSGGDQEALKRLVKMGVEYATENDLYVIIDWHILHDNDPRMHTEEAIAFFNEMSAEFANWPNVIYELCNEPNGSTTFADIKEYALQVIPVIRANSPDALILVGTPNWCQSLDQAVASPISEYGNLMYSLHFYAATHQEYNRDILKEAHENGLPVFVSEYGLCSADGNGVYDLDQADIWRALLDEYNISYLQWSIANQNSKCAIFKPECTKVSGFTHEDLSTNGLWLAEILGGSLATPSEDITATNQPEVISNDGNMCAVNENWGSYIDVDAGGDATITAEDGVITVHVIKSGKNSWSIQPNYTGITLEMLEQYDLSFTIISDAALQFDVTLQKNYDPYSAYMSAYGITMDPGEKQVTQHFTMMSVTDDNVALCFNIGGNAIESYNVTIKDVVLKKAQ